jgi:Mrp family chromosome partitioning ATPase
LNSAATGTIDDVLANGMFKSIVNFARSQFDYIILDTAPMGLVPDAEGIARFVDASVLVVRQDRVMARSINDAIDTLNNSGARVLGVVFNDMTSGSTAVMGGRIYGGGYGR